MSNQPEGRIPEIRSHVAYHLITNYGGICSTVHTGKFAAYSMLSSKIISGDKALQEIRDSMGIKVQSPRQFLDDFSKRGR